MRKTIKTILTVVIAFVFGLTVFSACDGDSQVTRLISEYGITVDGGGFENGSTLVTDLIELVGEKGQKILSLLEGQDYLKDGKMNVYDIFVSKDGKEVQPDGSVVVTVPAPFESENGYVVFHVKDDDTVEKMNTSYNDGKISFETDSFSCFVIAEDEKYYGLSLINVDGQGTVCFEDLELSKKGDALSTGRHAGKELPLAVKDIEEGYAFIGWFGSTDLSNVWDIKYDNLISAETTFNFTMPAYDYVIYAVFRPIRKYNTLGVINVKGLGTVGVDGVEASDESDLSVSRVEGSKSVLVAKDTLDGYAFFGWYGTMDVSNVWALKYEVLLSTEKTFTFTMPAYDYVIYAVFKPVHTVYAFADKDTEGTIKWGEDNQSTSPEVKVAEGKSVTLTAVPNEGCKFLGWYDEPKIEYAQIGNLLCEDAEYTINVVDMDVNIYARFETIPVPVPEKYPLSVGQKGAGGTVSINGGQPSSLESVVYYEEFEAETAITLVAAPRSNDYAFIGWFEPDGDVSTHLVLKETPVSTELTYLFNMTEKGYAVYAVFEAKVTGLILDAANAGFTEESATYVIGDEFKPVPERVIVSGATVIGNIPFVLNEDYTIDLGGLSFTQAGTYTITYTYKKDTAIKETLTIEVVLPKYAFSALVTGGTGTISYNNEVQPNGYYGELTLGTKISLTATAGEGYLFKGWYEPDGEVSTQLALKETPVSTNATHEFTAPGAEYVVYAVFEAKVTGLILDGANAGFTEGKATYTIGEANKPTPENVIVSGATVLGSVPFTKDVDYTIDLGGLDFERAGTYTITYTYVKDTNIKETLTIEVVAPKFTFSAVTENANGSIYYNNEVQPNGYQAELTAGTKVTLTATPSDGYNFVGWFEPEATDATTLVLKETPVSTSATYEFTVPAKEYRVYSVFEEVITYTFSAYITGEGGYFEINGTDGGRDYWAEKLNTGDRITLKVVANRGYKFKGWYAATDVPSFISASAEYTFTVENADISVEAVFEAKVTGLILDGANAGFTEGKATYTIGEANKPTPENVIVSGATVLGSVPFTKDVDYTIDLGGLDFERAGTYTITYTYVKDTNIKETLTIEVVAPKFTFSAVTENANGSIYYNNEVQPNGYQAELEANTSVTLKAVAKNDYEFVGWYTATDVPEFISESAEYTFVTGNADKYVMARFAAKILYLWSDSSNAGFNDNEKSATVTIGDSVLPDPQAVLIYAGTAEGDVLLAKNVDYTIELGGLDFSQEGTYTITYRHTKNTSLTTTLTVYVVAAQTPVTINLSYSGTADPVKYNGGRAAYVFKSSILNNGEACDIESLGLFYEWRDHTTKAVVAVAKDDTWDSTSAHYPSPAVPGTYDFVVYKLENEVKTDLLTVTRTIVENQFAVVTDLSSLSEYVCYTFIAKAGDNYYAMSNPFTGNSEREAILVTPDSNGVISLGNNYEYVFRPYNTGKTSSSGLVCYGCRTGNGLNRTGNLVLWGTGGIEYTTSTSADYTVTFVLNADGTITVHAPFCEGTLRLVYDATSGKFMFTAKKAVDDTRTSYPVYLYGEYTEPVVEPKETYEFFGKLSKAYDGNAVSFNVYKEVNIFTENGEDVAVVLKNGTGRFVWTDAKGNVISVGTPDENGNVTGPSAIGSYRLVFQTLQKGENGMEWVEKAVLHSFEITAPAEVN